ncbi:MAG: hypothetical protein AAF413_03980 [Patescibacteria group bacterium]
MKKEDQEAKGPSQPDAGATVNPSVTPSPPQMDDAQSVTAMNSLMDDGNPVIAEDAEVIEKSWVKKAKKIVEDTQGDPRKQKEALSEFKADYMKKRFGKDLKIEQEK